ncbi:hypothetical protein FHS39_000331 [Streptomyces olivoverticillatus]|uniref:FXSXX-COOH protein n=1 Tax=Streptomyces olivoverticillatus TaxID=66427 RepID=A0A7W7LKK4_9ACTN|nr:hypothetical protein [Streptomyces olivoverticillatus]
MLKHTNTAPAGHHADPAEESGRAAATPPLPDLGSTDLRTLRATQDPALAAAVEGALLNTASLADIWYSGGGEAGALREADPAVTRRDPDN